MSKRNWDKPTAKYTKELERFIKGKKDCIRYYIVYESQIQPKWRYGGKDYTGEWHNVLYLGTSFDDAMLSMLHNREYAFYIDMPKTISLDNMNKTTVNYSYDPVIIFRDSISNIEEFKIFRDIYNIYKDFCNSRVLHGLLASLKNVKKVEQMIPRNVVDGWCKKHYNIETEGEWFLFVEEVFGSYCLSYNDIVKYPSCYSIDDNPIVESGDKWISQNKAIATHWRKQFEGEIK